MQVLNPPELFACVESGLYRSNAFQADNFSFIKTLHLKTIVYVSPDMPLKDVYNFIQYEGIQLVRIWLIQVLIF